MNVNLEIIQSAHIQNELEIEELNTKNLVPEMMMRRRLTRSAKIFTYLADQVGFTQGRIFYGSNYGEIPISNNILLSILNGEPISPTDFQNSVYNAPASYFSILKKNRNEILTISSGDLTSLKLLQLGKVKAKADEEILLIAVEAINIANISEVNHCIQYLEAGVALKVKISSEEHTLIAEEFQDFEGIPKSLTHLYGISKSELPKRIVSVLV